VREAALIAVNILKNIDFNPQNNENSIKIEGIQEFYSRYKNQNLNQKRLSVNKVQTQHIAQKYLSDNKRFTEEYKSNSYMNSPSNQERNPNYNKANSANNFNQHKTNFLEEKEQNSEKEQENNSRDLIGQQDMAYLFNKMEIIMIQQNKIFENFINFESDIKNEISEIKQKITRIENTAYSKRNNEAKIENLGNFKSLKNEEKNSFHGNFSRK